LEAVYRGADLMKQEMGRTVIHRPLEHLGGGHHRMEMVRMEGQIRERLSVGEDLDGVVRVAIRGDVNAAQAPPLIQVARFDIGLQVEEFSATRLILEPEDTVALEPSEVEALELEAINLLDPTEAPLPLARLSSLRWEVPETMSPGPYMITGRQGDWYRVRPMPWYHDPAAEQATKNAPPSTLAGLYGRGDVRPGRTAMLAVLEAMGEDTGHPDWSGFWGRIEWVDRLLGLSFPLMRCIADPSAAKAAALAVFLAPEEVLERYWREMETLPFWWHLVPLALWEEALRTLVDDVRRDLKSLADEDLAFRLEQQVDRAIDRVTERMPCLEAPLKSHASRLLGRSLGTEARVSDPALLRDHFLRPYRERQRKCPALHMSANEVPWLDGWESLRSKVEAHPGGSDLVVIRSGPFSETARAVFADAPAITALVSLTGIRLGPAQIRALRTIHDRDPRWFDQCHQEAYVYAFGSKKRLRIQEQLDD